MKNKLLCLSFVLCSLSAISQTNYWRSISQNDALKITGLSSFFKGGFQPVSYKLFTLDEVGLASVLKGQQSLIGNDGVIIYLPVADGSFEKFSIKQSSVMEPELQARYEDINTFKGQSLDDPSKSVVFSYSKLGLHASIMVSDDKTTYINAVSPKSNLYTVFARNDLDKSEIKFKCETEFGSSEKLVNKIAPSGNIDDGKLRTYRLALCTTGEWSQFFMTGMEQSKQDSTNTVLSSLVVYLTRVNQVYERDLGVHMIFVANEDKLIFLNPSTDPFTPTNLNAKCQETCDARIGNARYDIGHVLNRGSDNGNAGCIACVCKTGSKGSGFSTYSKPNLEDYFVIDYWGHEMGHQFGANHTFTFYNEGTSAQIEPGSGSTIMGYAGITGSTDVQSHSDDLFGTASIAQVSAYLKTGTGGNCPAITETGNHAPTAAAGVNRVIPISTPFILQGKGSDTDKSDRLSYIWEQVDVFEAGANTFPRTTTVKGPEFRTFNYTNSSARIFPSEKTVLNGAIKNKWESLSEVSRELNFRFTVRDNHPGGGNNKSDNMTVKVTNVAGPFKITSPNTAVSWEAGSTKTIKWDVANTDVAPVNCARVKILLSTNGGKTWNTVLKESVPNNGAAKVVIPATTTVKARIAIFAEDNIFFDYSDSDFTIASPAIVAAKAQAEELNAAAKNISFTVMPNPVKDVFTVVFNSSLENAVVQLVDMRGRQLFTKRLSAINKGHAEKISVNTLAKGNYFLKVTTGNGTKAELIMVN